MVVRWISAGLWACLAAVSLAGYDRLAACEARGTLNVAMVALDGDYEQTRTSWAPTFETTLNKYLNRLGCFFRLEVWASEAELADALARGEAGLDLVFAGGGEAAYWQRRRSAVPIATLYRRYGEQQLLNKVGGLMLRRASRYPWLTELAALGAASDLTLCAVSAASFDGYLVQRYELWRRGLDVESVFGDRVLFTQQHRLALQGLVDGTCDVAFARAGTLHDFNQTVDGLQQPGWAYNLNDEFADSQAAVGLWLSTPLQYHEWTVLALPHVPREVWQEVRAVLTTIQADDPAAVAGGHGGFCGAEALSFALEEEVWYQLDLLPGGGVCAPGMERQPGVHGDLPGCVACLPGQYSLDGRGCQLCPPGTWASAGATACQPCAAGTGTASEGSAACLPLASLASYEPIEACRLFPNGTVTIVMAAGAVNEARTRAEWLPTFEDALNEHLNRFGCAARLEVLASDDRLLELAIWGQPAPGVLDLVFLPGGYVPYLAYHLSGARPVASVVRRYPGGRTYTKSGGVILCRSDDTRTNVSTLAELARSAALHQLTLCAPSYTSFEGYLAQGFEFYQYGVELGQAFPPERTYLTGGRHEEAVLGLWGLSDPAAAGAACDVALARSSTLEALVEQGRLNAHAVAVLHEQALPGFELRASTPLYTEGTLVALPHVADEIRLAVTTPLLAMQSNSEAAGFGGHAGFVAPRELVAEAEVWYQLGLMSIAGVCMPGSMRQATMCGEVAVCVQCASGTYNVDGRACLPCPAGTFNEQAGSTECQPCPAGLTTGSLGSTFCMLLTELATYEPLAECGLFRDATLRIGMVGNAALQQQWGPTFQDTINKHLGRFGCRVTLEMLASDTEMLQGRLLGAVNSSGLEFAFLAGGDVPRVLRHAPGTQPLASVVRKYSALHTYSKFGGVILRLRGSGGNQSNTLAGLAREAGQQPGLRLCAVSYDSFEGYLAQRYEFFKQGLELAALFPPERVRMTNGHDESVLGLWGVGAEKCDVALARTYALESLAGRALVNQAEVVVVNAQSYRGFKLAVSTELYTEWTLLALPHVSAAIRDAVRTPLLAMQSDTAAAMQGQHAGFVQPPDFAAEANVWYQLNLMDPVGGACAAGSTRAAAPAGSAAGCEPCAAGRYNQDGLACLPCPLGFRAGSLGSTRCELCPEGTTNDRVGSQRCEPASQLSTYEPLPGCEPAGRLLVVGISAVDGGREVTLRQWQPTLEEALNSHMNRFGCSFELRVLANDSELSAELMRGPGSGLDLAFLPGGDVPFFHYHLGAVPVASVVRKYGTQTYRHFAGVMVRRADTNQDLRTLADFSSAGRTLRLCAVARDSFEGYVAQWFEFFRHGLDLSAIFDLRRAHWAGEHRLSILGLYQQPGLCDVAFARSYALEALLAQGLVSGENYFVIEPAADVARAGFGLALSTPLYREWTLLALPARVQPSVWENARIPLLSMQAYSPAAVAGGHAGFVSADSDGYDAEARVWYELDLLDPAGHTCAPGHTRRASSSSLGRGCEPCPPGLYNRDGRASLPCPLGQFNNASGSTSCSDCAEGWTTLALGSTGCVQQARQEAIYEPIGACSFFVNNRIRIGMPAVDAQLDTTRGAWEPTFQQTLNAHMNRYNCSFRLQVLENDGVLRQRLRDSGGALDPLGLDLAFVAGGDIPFFQHMLNATPVASVLRRYDGQTYASFGGVLVKRTTNPALIGIETLAQLRALLFVGGVRPLRGCAVSADSFEGFLVHRLELFNHGLRVEELLSGGINFTGRHDEAVLGLWRPGGCDLALARTYTLEKLVLDGRVGLGDFRVLNEQQHAGFHLHSSTPLYNEWTLLALPHVAQEIWENMRIPLLALREYDQAATAGNHAGFIIPHGFAAPAEVWYQLNLLEPASWRCGPGYERLAQKEALRAPAWSKQSLRPCVPCAPGLYSASGLGTCLQCAPGTFGNLSGQAACLHCPAGRATRAYGGLECLPRDELIAYKPIESCQHYPNRTLVIGMLAQGEEERAVLWQKWQPTFEDTLNEYFRRYQCYLRLELLDALPALPAGFCNGSSAAATTTTAASAAAPEPLRRDLCPVDFVFLDPGTYLREQQNYSLQALASVVRIFNGRPSPLYGGVIFARSDRLLPGTPTPTIEDLAKYGQSVGLTLCIPSRDSFAGFHLQWYEFFKRGYNLQHVFQGRVKATGSYASVLEKVLNPLDPCQVGMIRTSHIERAVSLGLYRIEDFKIINAQNHQGYDEFISTELYYEWPLAALAHVEAELRALVPVPLLALREWDAAAIAGEHAGFTQSFEYSAAQNMQYQLGLAADASCGPGSYRQPPPPAAAEGLLGKCVPCAEGRYSPYGTLAECLPCQPGYYAPAPAPSGAALCRRCPFGTNALGTANRGCVPYVDILEPPRPARWAVLAMTLAAAVGCSVVFALIIKFRKSRLIRASSFHFSLVLVAACGGVCASAVLFALPPSPGSGLCALRWWVPCLLSSVVFGALFSKTYRLYAIFRIFEPGQKVQVVRFKDTKVALMVAIFVGATAAVLAVFFLARPSVFELQDLTPPDQNYRTLVRACSIDRVFPPLVFGLYVAVLVGQSWLAFRVRRLPSVFNESKLIAWLLYNTVFLGLVGLTVDFLLDRGQVTAKLTVRVVAIMLGGLTPVCVLYGPKLLLVYQKRTEDSAYSSDTAAPRPAVGLLRTNRRAQPPAATTTPPQPKKAVAAEKKNNNSASGDEAQYQPVPSSQKELLPQVTTSDLSSSSGQQEEASPLLPASPSNATSPDQWASAPPAVEPAVKPAPPRKIELQFFADPYIAGNEQVFDLSQLPGAAEHVGRLQLNRQRALGQGPRRSSLPISIERGPPASPPNRPSTPHTLARLSLQLAQGEQPAARPERDSQEMHVA